MSNRVESFRRAVGNLGFRLCEIRRFRTSATARYDNATVYKVEQNGSEHIPRAPEIVIERIIDARGDLTAGYRLYLGGYSGGAAVDARRLIAAPPPDLGEDETETDGFSG